MREKSLRLVVAFPNTTNAMAMEKYCRQRGVGGRLIAVPPSITAAAEWPGAQSRKRRLR